MQTEKETRRYTPVACTRTQMLTAAVMWTVVGTFLFGRGLLNIVHVHDPYKLLWILAALAAGIFKAKMVLEKTAEKIARRIVSRPDPSCLFGFMPVRSWLLIGAMICLGVVLRHSPLNRSLVWSIYMAIGAALFASSRIFWRYWNDFASL